jgi:hypothetical protein
MVASLILFIWEENSGDRLASGGMMSVPVPTFVKIPQMDKSY